MYCTDFERILLNFAICCLLRCTILCTILREDDTAVWSHALIYNMNIYFYIVLFKKILAARFGEAPAAAGGCAAVVRCVRLAYSPKACLLLQLLLLCPLPSVHICILHTIAFLDSVQQTTKQTPNCKIQQNRFCSLDL